MPYFAILILALFLAITIGGVVGLFRHFADKTKKSAVTDRSSDTLPS